MLEDTGKSQFCGEGDYEFFYALGIKTIRQFEKRLGAIQY